MSVTNKPIDFNSTGDGENTRIDYTLVDGGNKVSETIVLSGRIDANDVEAIMNNLKDGNKFLPNEIGVPDLLSKMPSSWDEDYDKDYLHTINRISYTDTTENGFGLTAEKFVEMIVEEPDSTYSMAP